jgi:hypothetical protein
VAEEIFWRNQRVTRFGVAWALALSLPARAGRGRGALVRRAETRCAVDQRDEAAHEDHQPRASSASS